jgi:hypothetical protein
MRYALPLLVLLLAGCLSQEAAQAGPEAPQQPAPAQQASPPAGPVPEISGNISAATQAHADAAAPEPENDTDISANGPGADSEAPERPQNASGPDGSETGGALAFAGGNYTIMLDDVSIIPVSTEPCGIFSLHEKDGSLIEKLLICTGESEYWQSPGGGTYRIHVLKVAAGYSGNKWAQVIVYG